MNVEESFSDSRIHNFLKDITNLCKKHNAHIYTGEVRGIPTIILDFPVWEGFTELEASPTSSSVYWPRIESHIVHEEKVDEKALPMV